MKKKIFSLILILIMLIASFQCAYGAVLSDISGDLSQAEDDLADANNDISFIESEISNLQDEIDEVDSELVETLANIDIINAEIAETEEELEAAQGDLAEAQEQEDEQYEAMKARIKYMYEEDVNNSFINAILSSSTIAEILDKISYFTGIYDYDRNLLDDYESTVAEVESLIEEISDQQSQLTEIQDSYEEEQAYLENILSTKQAEEADYESDLAQAQALASQYESLVDELQAAYEASLAAQAAAAAEESTSQETTASSGSTSTSTSTSSSSSSSSSSSGQSSQSAEETTASSSTQDNEDDTSSGSTSYSGTGSEVASYALQFVGNPYVYGGTSLTNGCDCSGFVMSVYAHFGVSLPHSSSALRSVGTGVSVSDMQPGDIVCYSGHVAIYIGNNTIVHASNETDGIKTTTPANYRTILAVRRIFT